MVFWLLVVLTLSLCSCTKIRCRRCGAHVADSSDSSATLYPAMLASGHDIVSTRIDPDINMPIQTLKLPANNLDLELGVITAVNTATTYQLKESKLPSFLSHYTMSNVMCTRCKSPVGLGFKHNRVDVCERQAAKASPPSTAKKSVPSRIASIEKALKTKCLLHREGYWTYQYCFQEEMHQFHITRDDNQEKVKSNEWSMGQYTHRTVNTAGQVMDFHDKGGQPCVENDSARHTQVVFQCCPDAAVASIKSLIEPHVCEYVLTVCVPTLCEKPSSEDLAAVELVQQQCIMKAALADETTPIFPFYYGLSFSNVVHEKSEALRWIKGLKTLSGII